jgi:hypothetical protein
MPHTIPEIRELFRNHEEEEITRRRFKIKGCGCIMDGKARIVPCVKHLPEEE